MSKLENEVQREIRLALGKMPGLVLWRNNTGVAKFGFDGEKGRVRYGLCEGSSDLVGIITLPNGTGRFIALEVKRHAQGSKESELQEKFLALVRSRGGFAATVRDAEEAKQAVERARLGAAQ